MLSPNNFDNDKLALKPFCEKLEQFVTIDHDFAEGGLVIGLTSPFGTGKSSFLRMWKSDLDRRRIVQESLPQAVILNAWELDYCDDPLFAILAKLAQAVPVTNQSKMTAVREAASDFGYFTLSLANDFASKATGLDALKAGEYAKKKKQERAAKPDFLKMYEDRADAFDRLKTALRDAFGGDSPSAFIFVDELDRCRPDYAVSYLETIKHVFDIHGLVFVLAIDYSHLESSSKSLFGEGLVFPEYFRKFVQRTFELPKIEEAGYQKLAEACVDHFLEIIGRRSCTMEIKNIAAHSKELIAGFRMTPRQIQEVFRIIGHALSGPEEKRGKLAWSAGAATILMCVLKIASPGLYKSIGLGSREHATVGRAIQIAVQDHHHAYWWFRIYLSGALGRQSSNDEAEKALKELGFLNANATFDDQSILGEFDRDWGWFGRSESTRLKTVYNFIESATRLEISIN